MPSELIQSVKKKDLASVKKLINEGVEVNVQDDKGNTPLHYAIENNHLQITEALLEKEADYTIKNNMGYTPTDFMYDEKFEHGYVYFNIKDKYKAIEGLIKETYCDSITFINRGDLFAAAIDGDLSAFKRATGDGGVWEVDIRLSDGSTALHLAAKNGHAKIVKALLDFHSTVPSNNVKQFINIADKKGKTALDYAKEGKYAKIIDILLEINGVANKKTTVKKDIKGNHEKLISTNLSPVEKIEKKIIKNIVNALKNEYEYGNVIGNELKNVVFYSTETTCDVIWVNNKTPQKEILAKQKISFDGEQIFDYIFSDDEVIELNDVLAEFGNDDSVTMQAISWLMNRICAKLEQDKAILGKIPVSKDCVFLYGDHESEYFGFNQRKEAKENLKLSSQDYLIKLISE